MSSRGPREGTSASFLPRHIMTQIDGLIDSAIHANLDVFVFAYDNENYDDRPGCGCGIEGVSGTPDEVERTIWRATTKAEQRFLRTGFYHERSVPWPTRQKIGHRNWQGSIDWMKE